MGQDPRQRALDQLARELARWVAGPIPAPNLKCYPPVPKRKPGSFLLWPIVVVPASGPPQLLGAYCMEGATLEQAQRNFVRTPDYHRLAGDPTVKVAWSNSMMWPMGYQAACAAMERDPPVTIL